MMSLILFGTISTIIVVTPDIYKIFTVHANNEKIIVILLAFLFSILILFFSAVTDLILGLHYERSDTSWNQFQKWLATCQTAHLDRSALVNLIGEKSLCLLESDQQKHANREP